MFKHRIALLLGALAMAWVSPAIAQTPQGTAAGTLTCQLAPSIGLIIGSQQRMACRFVPNGAYPPEAYVGVMNSLGLDIGITAGGVMAWGVITPNAGPMRGKLAGKYVGASGSIGLRRRRRRQCPGWRLQPLDLPAAAFGRGDCRDQPVARNFGAHACVGTMSAKSLGNASKLIIRGRS